MRALAALFVFTYTALSFGGTAHGFVSPDSAPHSDSSAVQGAAGDLGDAAVEPGDPVAAWSATLTVGEDRSISPAALGYSLAGLDGTLSPDTFTLDGTEHRVSLLTAAAGGLYFGLSEALQTEFTLQIGDRQFTSEESFTTDIPIAVDTYWWGDGDLGWNGGDTVQVTLTPAARPSAGGLARPAAPLGAYFRLMPENHDGVDPFTFRVSTSPTGSRGSPTKP